jgi:hypothetical protein
MKTYVATFIILGNCFWSTEIQNTEGDEDEVREAAEQIARRMGFTFLYMNDKDDL